MKIASHRRAATAQLHAYEVSKIVKHIETESRMVATRGWGSGRKDKGGVFKGYEVVVLEDE